MPNIKFEHQQQQQASLNITRLDWACNVMNIILISSENINSQ
jgi:hypothetical protein